MSHNFLEVSGITSLNEETKLVAKVFAEVEIFGLFVELAPLNYK